jgi:CRP-like cAMP-binding protein
MALPEERPAHAASLLEGFWLCRGLSAAQLEQLARSSSFRSVERGEVVLDYGGDIQHVYCVLSGMVKLLITTERRSERIVELVGAGQTFGEGLLFSGQPSVTRAVAIDDGRLLLVPRRALVAMLTSSPELGLRWLQRVSQRVARLLAELHTNTGESAGQRIVRWLASHLGEQAGTAQVSLDISKATLAASLNTTPETFSRVLRHLRQQGVVRVEGRQIVVTDPVRLRYLQPCVFCTKPQLGADAMRAFARPDPLEPVTAPPECEVPHWFGLDDCDCEVPHWYGAHPGHRGMDEGLATAPGG